MFDPRSIFEFIVDRQSKGESVALVTILNATGGSTRNPGAQMAVCEGGSYVGSLSGGCIEQAVVSEAKEVLAGLVPRQIRYGAGSPYLDIRLPCGGSLDLLISPLTDVEFALSTRRALIERRPYRQLLSMNSASADCTNGSGELRLEVDQDIVSVDHPLPLQLAVIGTGDAVSILAKLAAQVSIEVYTASPEAHRAKASAAAGQSSEHLTHLSQKLSFEADHCSAAAFLFHDHDWEPELIDQILQTQAFYIGAMGSRATHKAREETLLARGLNQKQIDRVEGPIGLIHSLRDPETLAVSILAQIIDRYNRTYLCLAKECA